MLELTAAQSKLWRRRARARARRRRASSSAPSRTRPRTSSRELEARFAQRDLPGADAARGRARTAVPVHLGALALARRHRPRPRLGRGALRAREGARDAAALRLDRRARPADPARGRDLALPELGLPRDGPHRARRLPRHPRRRHRDLGRRGRPARGGRERAPEAPLRRGRAARGVELDLARDGGAADRAARGPPRRRLPGPRAARPARGDAALRPRPPRPEVRAVGAADAAPAREAEGRRPVRGDRVRRHRRPAPVRLVRDERRGVRARRGEGSGRGDAEDDRLPDEPRLGARAGADRGGRERQAERLHRRAEGALRRARATSSGRARSSRRASTSSTASPT